jgi:hypothetical protein
VILPLLLFAFARWVVQRWRGSDAGVHRGHRMRMNPIVLPALLALALFGVVRNFVPYLGSGGAL